MTHERDIVEARRYLSRIRVWPKARNLHVEAWVENFEHGIDREVAHALLDSFVFINDDHRIAALSSTIRSLSTRPEFGDASARVEAWERFLGEAIASIPLSFAGDGAASGYQYLRTARALGFARCIDSERLIHELLSAKTLRPIVFLDDISGTGGQFIANWERVYSTQAGRSSLRKLAAEQRLGAVYFVPIVATELAKAQIEARTEAVVHPAYLLGEDYSANSPDTRLVPDSLREHLIEVATRHAPSTGLDADGPLGYKAQGLAVSFQDKAPNNTLPILQPARPSPTWKPLISDD
ncbi:hypothetical protein MRBLWO14_002469 [Microbacterium sp. LWO14-1.2]|uniref:phosphoribosyltransferase-like protein n=1 Tax=unclassified Microbacterium TaxID=2609290 RepID=UPI003138D2F9